MDKNFLRKMSWVVLAVATIAGSAAAKDGALTTLSTLSARPLPTTQIAQISQACDASLPYRDMRFGANGQTLLVSCGDVAPLGGFAPAEANLHVVGDPGVPGLDSSARIFEIESGRLRLNIGPPKIAIERHELISAVEALGYQAWVVGTDKDEKRVPSAYVMVGQRRQALSLSRSATITAEQIDATTAAVLYNVWTDPGHFPDTYVARFNVSNGDVISNSRLNFSEGGEEFVVGSQFTSDGVTVFYSIMSTPIPSAQWYVGGVANPLGQTRFTYDGSVVGASRVIPGGDARIVYPLNAGFLFTLAQTPGCPQAVAAVVSIRGDTIHCFRRTAEQQVSDHLRHTRPTPSEQYSFTARPMDGGRFIVVLGQVGIDELGRDPDHETTAHIFDASGVHYLGSLAAKAIAISDDAPLIAAMSNAGDVSIHRLTAR